MIRIVYADLFSDSRNGLIRLEEEFFCMIDPAINNVVVRRNAGVFF